jgi:serine/threonine-protein kinase
MGEKVFLNDSSATAAAIASKQRLVREEFVSDLIRMRWVTLIGVVAWPLFTVQDIIVFHFVGIGRFLNLLAIRGVVFVAIVLLFHRLRAPKPLTRNELTKLDVGIFILANAAISILCIVFGGITSCYFAGLLITLIVRTSALAAHWRRGLMLLGTPLLSFPLTFLVAALLRNDIHEQFCNTNAIATFAQNTFALTAALGICVWSGHENWRTRRLLFESRSVGKYNLKHCIGRGGMGEVWLAYHTGLQHDVALKILNPEQDSDPTTVQRFEQEVAAMTQLTHPNTVRVFDYGVTEDGIWYYAMELLDGVTLKDLVQSQGHLTQSRAIAIAHQIARALAEAHDLGIIHRDIKPENIFITHAGNEQDLVKVLDFGIAKLRDTGRDVSLTRTGTIFGSPAYMSPEAAKGLPVSPASDVYGVGGILHFMLTGSPPFISTNPTELLFAHAERAVPSVKMKIGTSIDAALEILVERCLSKLPEDRFVDAGALSNAISELRRKSEDTATHNEMRFGG